MAGYDPKQPRDKDGQWTIAGNSARKAAGLADNKTFMKSEIETGLAMENPFARNTIAYLTPDGQDIAANVEYMDRGAGEVEFNIIVPEENRNRGYGTAVLKGIMERAKKAGITLTGSPESFGSGKKLSNAALWKWYLSLGFEKKGDSIVWR